MRCEKATMQSRNCFWLWSRRECF